MKNDLVSRILKTTGAILVGATLTFNSGCGGVYQEFKNNSNASHDWYTAKSVKERRGEAKPKPAEPIIKSVLKADKSPQCYDSINGRTCDCYDEASDQMLPCKLLRKRYKFQ